MISTAPAQVTQPQLVVATTTAALPESHSSPLSGNALSVETPNTEPVSEEEKKHIYKHPLFPLLALLFEKCEQATQTPDCPPCDSFDNDIQSFVAHQEQDQRPFFSEDTDLDALMVKAIQVLRIHLLELEKVNELCKDFCNRYIACLKGKLHSENLLRNELGFDDDFSISSPPSAQTSPIGVQQQSGLLATVSGSNVVIQQNVAQPSVSMATLSQGQIVSGGTVYQMVQTPQGLVAQPIQIQTGGSSVATAQTPGNVAVQGSTPLSQIGVPTTPVQNQGSLPSLASTPLTMGSGDEDDDIGGKRRNKRGVLPKSATQVMRSWLFQHIVHPYPSEDEKRQIAQQTNLTLLQVNNWFINARRRILQPMLDASNPDQAKAKKNKPQTRPAQRFWPDSIANLQPQPKPSASEESVQGSDLPTASTSSTSDTIVKSPTTIAIPTQTGLSQQIVLPPGTIITADGQILTTAAAPNGGGATVAFTTSTSLAPSVQVTSIAAPTSQFISVSADGSSSLIKAEPSPQLNLDDSSDDSLGD